MSPELDDTERELVEEIAAAVVKRRLSTPAMMFLEMSTPMNMLGASALHMASPLWRAVLPASRIDALAKLLEKRESIPILLRAIDDAEERRRLEARSANDPPTSEASP